MEKSREKLFGNQKTWLFSKRRRKTEKNSFDQFRSRSTESLKGKELNEVETLKKEFGRHNRFH